jgi:hypothetical protein
MKKDIMERASQALENLGYEVFVPTRLGYKVFAPKGESNDIIVRSDSRSAPKVVRLCTSKPHKLANSGRTSSYSVTMRKDDPSDYIVAVTATGVFLFETKVAVRTGHTRTVRFGIDSVKNTFVKKIA